MHRASEPAAPMRRISRWLPDADVAESPLASWALQMAFDLWIRAFYRRDLLFPPDFRIAPATVIASNHQRDVDGPMLGNVLVQRRGLRFRWPLPFYAAREDLFRPGILARLTVHWPKPLPALLGRISLAWFFPLGRAEPMRRVREFTIGETLRTLAETGCGDDDCRDLLNARGRRELGVDGPVTLQALLATADPQGLERWWGLRRLSLPALRKVAPVFRAAVEAQIAHFARRLGHGQCVYFSPEGTITHDGHFGRVRGGFRLLCRAAAHPPWVQPVALSYDSLAPGRARVVIRIGDHFKPDTTLACREFNAMLRHAVLSLEPVTPSHLLARYLRHGPACFSAGELADWLARSHARLAADGVSLDPLFTRQPFAKLARERLRWLRRRHLVARIGRGFRNTCPRDVAAHQDRPANLVHFLDNNLADLVPRTDAVLPC